MANHYFDDLQSGTLSSAGQGAWISVNSRTRIRLIISGTFTGLNAVLETSISPGQAGTPVETIRLYSSATTVDLIDLPDGYYRFRVISMASGSVSYNIRTFRKTELASTPVWEDLRSPASSINPSGPVNGASVDADDGGLLFSASGSTTCAIFQQMPHAWLEGSSIKPHVHWTKTTSASGNVVWQLEYQIANVGDTFSGGWITDTASSTDPNNADSNTANQHLITSFTPVDMDGYRASCMLKIRVTRLGSDVADTYGANAKLIEFDIHFLSDSLGSGGEFIK